MNTYRFKTKHTTNINMAALACIAIPMCKSKNSTIGYKMKLLETWNTKNDALQQAIFKVQYPYLIHKNTTSRPEVSEKLDKWGWLTIDMFEWRWHKEILAKFPSWDFTYNTTGHYCILPPKYKPPEDLWKNKDTTADKQSYNELYNIPDDITKITYWDLFGVVDSDPVYKKCI